MNRPTFPKPLIKKFLKLYGYFNCMLNCIDEDDYEVKYIGELFNDIAADVLAKEENFKTLIAIEHELVQKHISQDTSISHDDLLIRAGVSYLAKNKELGEVKAEEVEDLISFCTDYLNQHMKANYKTEQQIKKYHIDLYQEIVQLEQDVILVVSKHMKKLHGGHSIFLTPSLKGLMMHEED